MVEAPPSVGELIDAGATGLKAAGIAEPRREALRIWAGIERVGVADVMLRRDEHPDDAWARRFAEAVRRRAAG